MNRVVFSLFGPLMSRLNRYRYRKKLQKVLSRADDEAFFQMIWAIDALQSGRAAEAGRCIRFPPAAATSDMTSKLAVYKWDLETLVGQLLVTPKHELRSGRNRITNCAEFNTCATVVNFLRELENAEAGVYLKSFGILNEMHRIAQRQFPWQRGYFNAPQFYRYAYIYGQGECAKYFLRTHGLTINEFSLVGFALFAAFLPSAAVRRSGSMEELGVGPDVVERAVAILSTPLAEARREAAKITQDATAAHGSSFPVAYLPSLLRRQPIVSFGADNERLRAPLPQLIVFRVTSGLFYDLIKGGSHLRNEAGDRFEAYSTDYMKAMLPRFEVQRSHRYQFGGNPIDTPDILVSDDGRVVMVTECKARKLSYGAQFADDPAVQAKSAYDEIAKGVFQLWRFFSHARRGFVTQAAVSPDAHGMVLTLDSWLMMSRELKGQVIATATAMAAASDHKITEADRRPVVFCAIEDLESTLASSDEDSFLRSMSAAREDRFSGWALPSIHQETRGETAERKPFPFKLGDVLPWWDATEELREQRDG